LGDKKGEIKNPLIHMATHESLLCPLKPNNQCKVMDFAYSHQWDG